MKIYNDMDLNSFEFWSGAKDSAELLTTSEMNEVESTLEDLYPDGMSDTDVNDLFWFDFETVCEWIGLNAEKVYRRNDDDYNEDEDEDMDDEDEDMEDEDNE